MSRTLARLFTGLVVSSAIAVAAPAFMHAAAARRDHVASITGKDGRKVTGQAMARPTADGTGTDITLSLDGDTPGAVRPWHVHTGSCAKSGGVVGSARAYTALTVDAKGHASGKATIAVPLADTSTYYVNIHDAASAMGIIVACGDLTRR
jgi:hypothetical protein